MFSGLRQNSTLYILDRKEKPTLKIGQVIGVSNPTPKYGQFGSQIGSSVTFDTTVDISVNVDGEVLKFEQIPSSLSIANCKDFVISESREDMCNEVESMLQNSKSVIESVDRHKCILSCCDDILSILNPQIAKDRETEERMNKLENKLEGMESKISRMYDAIVNNGSNNKNNKKYENDSNN